MSRPTDSPVGLPRPPVTRIVQLCQEPGALDWRKQASTYKSNEDPQKIHFSYPFSLFLAFSGVLWSRHPVRPSGSRAEIRKSLFQIRKCLAQIWGSHPLIWISRLQIWGSHLLIWISLPQIGGSHLLIWISLPQIGKSLFLIWISLPQIGKSLFLIWISLHQIGKAIS